LLTSAHEKDKFKILDFMIRLCARFYGSLQMWKVIDERHQKAQAMPAEAREMTQLLLSEVLFHSPQLQVCVLSCLEKANADLKYRRLISCYDRI